MKKISISIVLVASQKPKSTIFEEKKSLTLQFSFDKISKNIHFGFLGHSKTTFFIAVCSKIPLNSTFFWSLALCATCILLPPPFPPIESEAFLNLAIKVTTYNLIPICKNFPIWYIKSKGWGLEVGEKDFPNRYLCRFTHFFPSFKYITRSKY